ncbi:MAG: efflux RND transporter permease subunit, partial [Candidatus Omnitrophica bacterium]|nr:efflux RND transporter permease subunit [Candidatus Omnitrophota bacterium]
INLTGGSVFTDRGEVNIRTNGELTTIDQISQIIVRANDQGKSVRIGDLALLKNSFKDNDILYRTDSDQSINLAVVKKESGDILSMVEEIKETVSKFKETAPDAIQVGYVDDFSYFVKRRLGVLVNNGMSGALLILIVLFLVLAPPIAFTAAIDIPVTFFITLGIMKICGITINLMSMFGMIMVIGMLVDDAIIMAENVFRHIEKGGDPRSAAVVGGEEVMKPITASVLTSICAYLPLAFMSGIIGQYVRAIPIVVSIALTVSWLTTIFSIPTHAAEFTALFKYKTREHGRHWFDGIRDGYMFLVERAIRFRYITALIIGGFVLFTLTVILPSMKFVLFTSDGMDEFYVRAETKIGTPLEVTQKAMEPIEKLIQTLPPEELEHYVTEIGVNREQASDPTTQYGSHLAQIHVYLTPSVDRKRDAFLIMDEIKGKFTQSDILHDLRVDKVRPGPPVGRAVEAKIRGDEFDSILEVAQLFKEYLGQIKGVQEIDDDYEEGRDEVNIVLDETQMAKTGLNDKRIAEEVRNSFEGGIATTIQK